MFERNRKPKQTKISPHQYTQTQPAAFKRLPSSALKIKIICKSSHSRRQKITYYENLKHCSLSKKRSCHVYDLSQIMTSIHHLFKSTLHERTTLYHIYPKFIWWISSLKYCIERGFFSCCLVLNKSHTSIWIFLEKLENHHWWTQFIFNLQKKKSIFPCFFKDLTPCIIPHTAEQSLSSLGNHPRIIGKHQESSSWKNKIIIDPALDQFGETDWATSGHNLRLHSQS